MPRRNKSSCKKQKQTRCRRNKRRNRKTRRMRGGNGVGPVTMTTPHGAIPLNNYAVNLRPQNSGGGILKGGGFFNDFGTITGSGTSANMLNGIPVNNNQSVSVPPVKAMI